MPGPDAEELAVGLAGDRIERRQHDVEIVGVDEVEDGLTDDVGVPAEDFDRPFVAVPQDARGVDRNHGIAKPVDRRDRHGCIGDPHEGISARKRVTLRKT